MTNLTQIPFVFGNTEQQITPLGNSTANLKLSNLVIRMWTSFVYDLNPNGHGSELLNYSSCMVLLIPGLVSNVDKWPRYKNNASNFVFRADKSYIEKDVDRADAVAYINTIVR